MEFKFLYILFLAILSTSNGQVDDRDREFLIIGDRGQAIYTMDTLQTDDIRTVISGQTGIRHLDYDYVTQRIFFIQNSNELHSIRINGTDNQLLWTSPKTMLRVVVDPISRLVYYTASYAIGVLTITKEGRAIGFHRRFTDENCAAMRGLAVDPLEGWMFFGGTHSYERLERATMAFDRRKVLISKDLSQIYDIKLNPKTRTVHFVNSLKDKIERMSYDGENRRISFSSKTMRFKQIALDPDFMYFTNNYGFSDKKAISRAVRPYGRSVRAWGPKVFSYPDSLAIYDKRVLITGTNACSSNNGGCAYICTPIPDGKRACLCPSDKLRCNPFSPTTTTVMTTPMPKSTTSTSTVTIGYPKRCTCSFQLEPADNTTAFVKHLHTFPDIVYNNTEGGCDKCTEVLRECPHDCRAATQPYWGTEGLRTPITINSPSGQRSITLGQAMCQSLYRKIAAPGQRISLHYSPGDCGRSTPVTVMENNLCCDLLNIPAIGELPLWNPTCSKYY